MMSPVELNIAITNHVKAGNIDEAKELIETMPKFDKEQSAYRISKLLKRTDALAANDIVALRTKKQLLNESIENGVKFYKDYNANK